MASGRVGKANPVADTLTMVYQVPAGYYASVTIAIMNYSESSTTFKLSVVEAANATPTVADFLEYDCVITAKNVVERTQIVLGSQQKIMISCPTSSLVVNVFGIEAQV